MASLKGDGTSGAAKRVSRYDLITPMLPVKDEICAKFEKLPNQ